MAQQIEFGDILVILLSYLMDSIVEHLNRSELKALNCDHLNNLEYIECPLCGECV